MDSSRPSVSEKDSIFTATSSVTMPSESRSIAAAVTNGSEPERSVFINVIGAYVVPAAASFSNVYELTVAASSLFTFVKKVAPFGALRLVSEPSVSISYTSARWSASVSISSM